MKKKLKNENGQAMVEFALVLPILLFVVCGIIDFGWLFYNQLSLDNACREGARYAAICSTEEDCVTFTKEHINNILAPVFEEVEISITYTDISDKLNGDVVVNLEAEMHVLTPVLGAINGSQTKTLTSEVVMKVET
ncbi:MAG: TadE/TadG family type IV pilus assembly protein [Acutalibacteraceae bacterium]